LRKNRFPIDLIPYRFTKCYGKPIYDTVESENPTEIFDRVIREHGYRNENENNE